MNSATQREELAALDELCVLSPDVRVGQLLAHVGFLGEDQTGRSLWDIDDEELLAVLHHHRAELSQRQPAPLEQEGSPEASKPGPKASRQRPGRRGRR